MMKHCLRSTESFICPEDALCIALPRFEQGEIYWQNFLVEYLDIPSEIASTNWNAIRDYFNSFDYVQADNVVLLHLSLPDKNNGIWTWLPIYFEIVLEASCNWLSYAGKCNLYVVVNEEDIDVLHELNLIEQE